MNRYVATGAATAALAYGVAMAAREPLLFKGEDFPATDVSVVEY